MGLIRKVLKFKDHRTANRSNIPQYATIKCVKTANGAINAASAGIQ